MKSIHFSITTRRDGDLGGVPKFAWYLQKAIGCEVEPMYNADKFNLNEFDYIIADGSYINHFLQYKCKKISIIHGSWKEFCIRNNTNAFIAESAIQGKAWTNPNVITVAVSNSAAKYAIKHHNARIDHIINNAIDTDVFKPIAHVNVKPVVIHCANDYNKTSHDKLDAIIEILSDKFDIRYLNAKAGEEHTKMAQGDIYLSCSNYEGNSYACVTPDTKIYTENGFENISNLNIGRKVITSNGKFNKILRIDSRYLNENIYKIKCQKNSSTLDITGNHPVLCIKTKLCKRSTNKKSVLQICSTNKKNCNHCLDRLDAKFIPQWIMVKDLKAGDYLLTPRLNISNKSDIIDLSKYLDNKKNIFDEYKIWSKYSNSPKKSNLSANYISKILNVSPNTIRHVAEGNAAKKESKKILYSNIKKYLNKIGYKKNTLKKVNRKINIDANFMSLLGYWISEGYVRGNSILFAFNRRETYFHNEVIGLMKTIFNVDLHSKISTCENGCRLQFNSSIVSGFFKKFTNTGSRNKFIPLLIIEKDEEKLINLLRTLWNGDGCLNKNTYAYSSVNNNLLVSISNMLNKIGIINSINYEKDINHRGSIIISGIYSTLFYNKVMNKSIDKFKIHKTIRNSHSQSIINDNYILNIITSIKIKNYKGYVYNMEVENDHSYIANGFIVHNCLEAMSCGLPIVGSNVGLFDDIVGNNKYGLIIDYKSNSNEFANAIQEVYKKLSFYNPRQYVLDNANFINWKEKWIKLTGEYK